MFVRHDTCQIFTGNGCFTKKTTDPITPCYFNISSDYVFCVYCFWNEMRQKLHTEHLELMNKVKMTECLGCHTVTLQFALPLCNSVCAECSRCDPLLPFSLFCCVYSTVLTLLPTCPCLTHTHRSVEPPQLAGRHVSWPQLLKCQGSQVAFQQMDSLSVCVRVGGW